MLLSVLILNYNARHFLELCLQSVQAATATIEAEILVMDNNSTDGSGTMMKEKFPALVYIENTNNLGFSKAYNQAVQFAKGTYLCILNPDTVLGEQTFTYLFNLLPDLPKHALVGPRMIDGTGTFLPESKRNVPTPLTAFHRFSGIAIGKTKPYYAVHRQQKECEAVAVLTGAFMLVTKSKYLEVGGFDETYFMYGEDIDLSYTMEQHGFRNYYIGSMAIIHYKGESTIKDNTYAKRFYGAMHIFYKKYFRSYFFLDWIVFSTIRFMTWVHRFRKPKHTVEKVDQYVLLSQNKALHDQIAKQLSVPVVLYAQRDLVDLSKTVRLSEMTTLIFDADIFLFEQIINAFQNPMLKKCNFKIRPKNCNFIIGSNHSAGNGEVIVF